MVKVGVAFADFINKDRPSRYRHKIYHGYEQGRKNFRVLFLPIAFIALFSVLFLRSFFVQVVQGQYYRMLSDSNRTRTVTAHAPRGVIFDRNGEPLVFNIPGYRRVTKDKIEFLSSDEALKRLAKGEKNIEIDSLRKYPYAEATTHVLGYVGPITKEELIKEFTEYEPTDVIGQMGIERTYETTLKGKDGKELVEVDAMGKQIRSLGKSDPIPGKDITLTLDIRLQEKALESLKDVKKGTVIASTLEGEILALVSKPSFDANLFTLGKHYVPTATDAAYKKVSDILLDGENQPMLNRAISGTYPPGSTFKLITSAAGLENKIFDEDFTVEDTGIIRIGAFSFANWYYTSHGKTDGIVDVIKAIARSNDIFFYRVGDMIGVERLSAMAREFGLGQKLGIDLPFEEEGLVPTSDWKKKIIGEPWYLGDNFHYGIGQGYVLTTPLQVNVFTQVVANGGTVYEPHLLKERKPIIKNQKIISQKTQDLIHRGMVGSCTAETGVAWPFYEFKVKNATLKIDGRSILAYKPSTTSAAIKNPEEYRRIIVACKTGTAQHGGEKTLPHSWITLYAPAYNPEIVVTVLAESSGEGSNIAGPAARKVLEEWFSR